MLRFSVGFVAALTLMGASVITVSPALALSGEAYNKCMAKCQKASTRTQRCPAYCDSSNR
jgi:hypothetical protein